MLNKPKRILKSLKRRLLKQPNSIVPTGELEGYLESPQPEWINANGTLLIAGWVIHKTTPIKHLFLSVNQAPEEEITYGTYRPDIVQIFPEVPNSSASGFGWNTSITPQFVGNLEITISAILETGEKVCCFSRKIQILQPAIQSSQLKIKQFLKSAINKGWIAYKNGRLPLSPVKIIRSIQRYYRQTQAYQSTAFYTNFVHPWQNQDSYQRWLSLNQLTPKLLAQMQKAADDLKETGVKISVVVPIYNPPAQFLRDMITSVTQQVYPNWELCLADDASTQVHVREILTEFSQKDSRIKIIFRPENGHIVAATNSALDLATGEFIALLDHDDLLSPDALLQVAQCIQINPDIDWIYTDEDKIDDTGRRFDPQFKGAWAPEMAITHNYTHHLAIIRRTLIEKVGRLHAGFEGAQDLDLFLRVAEQTTPDKIKHIPQVCYHWRVHQESTALKGTQKRYVFESAYQAIQATLTRRSLKATPFLPAIAKQYDLCLHQLKWDNDILAQNPVTIIIPTRDRSDLLEKCVNSLVKTVDARYVKLIIVDDQSQEKKTLDYLKKLEAEKVLNCRVIHAPRTETQFNYSKLVNLGSAAADTPYILHLNNDIEATTPGWLAEMMGWMSIENIGVVGAKLVYPNQTIQHAGVVVGAQSGLAAHAFHRIPKDELGYIFLPIVTRNVTAVTGACLLTSTRLYQELGGFNETEFSVEFNDVDYCLRVAQTGNRIVYTPQASLTHLTSASRGDRYNPQEHLNFLAKYPNFRDSFVNPSLDIDTESLLLNPLKFTYHHYLSKAKILLITHNLNLEGAPLMAYKFAEYFATQENCQVSIISLEDGVLREAYEKLGIGVKVIDQNFRIVRESRKQYQQKLTTFGESIGITEFDVVVCNTMVSFWGIELAQLFNLPSIWHIHESTTVENSLTTFFGESRREVIHEILEDSFKQASRVIFVANATRKLFHEYDVQEQFRTIYGGMDLDQIETFKQTHSKAELREKYGIPQDKTVISIIGTTCDRKGQHIFLEAIKILQQKQIGASSKICCLIVGARETIYLEFLRQKITKLNLTNVKIYPETREVYDFFALSDIFVCASFEESFPRVILEAMAFELKIVSTSVFGIPEMIGDRQEAYLVRPGDPKAIADALLDCLEDDYSNRLPGNAHARVTRLFNNKTQLQKHLQLIKETILSDR